jgi:hypothetical protein
MTNRQLSTLHAAAIVLAALGAIAIGVAPASAQSRPLTTEDPETVPSGNILLEAGLDFGRDAAYPASGLRGNLWRIGTFGLSFGVSPIAEIQIDGGLRNRLSIVETTPAPLSAMLDLEDPTRTSDVEDLNIGAKIRFVAETETRPAIAVRFWTRLPNAGNESGLGLDTTDFHFGIAIAKTSQSIRMVGNIGFGILPDPVRGDRQNDVLDYGVSVARAVQPGVELVGELNGRLNTRSGTPPIGTESRSVMRIGSRLTRGPVRIDGGLAIGITDRDPTWGFTTGVTWVFKAFEVR